MRFICDSSRGGGVGSSVLRLRASLPLIIERRGRLDAQLYSV